jgi:predicted negative regulator of RcsB-dependent stress response
MSFVRAVRKGASAPFGRLALLLFPLLLGGCITIAPRSHAAGPSSSVIPDVPMLKWGVESCGAGSLSTVLQHYGDPTPMETWDAELPKIRGGVLTIDMLIGARKKGFDAQLVTGTPENVSAELAAGRPVILMLQVVQYPGTHYDFFHYIVLDGVDRERGLIRTQWGDQKGRWTSFAKIEKPWAGGGHAAIFIRPRSGDAEALRAAVALEDEGKYADAAARYREITAHDPHSIQAWTNLGNAERQLGNMTEAEQAYRKAIEADPATARDALNNLAWLLYEQKRLDEAEPLARKAVAEPGPDSYLMLDTLARVLAAKGSCDEARTTFRHAIDAVPATRNEARSDIEKAMSDMLGTCSRGAPTGTLPPTASPSPARSTPTRST